MLSEYTSNTIESHTDDQKLLHQTNEQQLLAHNDLTELTNHFGDANSARCLEETSCSTCVMSEFQTVSEGDVEKSSERALPNPVH